MKILHLLIVFLILYANNVLAVFTPGSCSALPSPSGNDGGYMNDQTVYGYVKANIDNKNHVLNGCDVEGNELKLCFRKADNTCEEVTMPINTQALIKNIAGGSVLVSNPIVGNIVLQAIQIEDKICLTMPTSRGDYPIVCRNSNLTPLVEEDNTGEEENSEIPTCSNISNHCFLQPTKSQSVFNFSGLTVDCMQQSLSALFQEKPNCVVQDNEELITTLAAFPSFQEYLRTAVRAALIIYVMVYGFMMVFQMEYAETSQIFMFIMKIILVGYFSVGIGPVSFDGFGFSGNNNGMVEIVLPLLLNLTNSFVELVFLSGGSQGLCVFDKEKYQVGYEFYKIWDAIDCRVAYYMGMQLIYTVIDIGNEVASVPEDAGAFFKDLLGFKFFFTMFGFFLAGNIVICLCGIVFAMVFLSTLFYFLSSYLICVLTLFVMAYISPIFIPMILFERTKGYFDSWLRIVMSCTLQPAIIGGAIAMMLTMYDFSMYGNCEFEKHEYPNFISFELKVPTTEPEKCISSAGYQLVNHYYKSDAWEEKILILFPVLAVMDAAYDGVNFLVSFVYLLVYTLLFYFFMGYMTEFASDLTGGVNLSSVAISPKALVEGIVNTTKSAYGMAKSMESMGADAGKIAKDKLKKEQSKEGSGAGGGEGDEGSKKEGGESEGDKK